MEENNTKEETKITLGLIIGWVLGTLAALAGVGTLFTEPVPGILFILLALVLLPPVNKLLKKKFNFSLSGGVKFVLVIVLFGAIGASFNTESVTQSGTVVSDTNTEKSETTEQETQPEQKSIEIVDVSTKVTEQNSVWWKYAWVLTLKNNTNRDRSVTAELKWVDADGFVVDSATEYSLTIPAGEEKTFNDFALISTPGSADVEGIQAELR
jgi:uncharacterized protein YcfL